MNTQSTFNEKQSLETIRAMIESSKQNLSGNAIYFLIWGWAIILAAMVQYAVLLLNLDFNTLYTWVAAIVFAGCAAVYTGIKQKKEKQASTFVDRIIFVVWAGSGGVFTILGMAGFVFGWAFLYPVLIAVFSWGVLTTGALLKFRPLIIGGIASFFFAGISVFIMNEHILLMLILSLTVSYLIPAYMLKRAAS